MNEIVDKIKEAAPAQEARPTAYTIVALTTLAALFVALGIKDDRFDRMLADHPYLSGASFALAVIAFGVTVMSFTFSRREAKKKRRLERVAVLALLASLIAGITAALALQSDRSPPRITAISKVLKDGSTTMQVTVKHEKVSAGQHVFVLVEHLQRVADGGRTTYESIRPLYETSVGAQDGVVDFPLTVALPPELSDNDYIGVKAWVGADAEDCYATRGFRTACAELHVSRSPERPQLRVAWRDPRTLWLAVSGTNMTGRTVSLSALVTRPRPSSELVSWSLAPSVHGTFSRTLSVRVPARARSICVTVSTSPTDLACPPKKALPTTVWQQMVRPDSKQRKATVK